MGSGGKSLSDHNSTFYLPAVAIVGRPNVGKSATFNRILGKREAIVHSVSGVTRDRHMHVCEWKGREFLLIDTGGYETAKGDEMIASIRDQVEIAISESDSIIFIVDGQAGCTPMDEEISAMFRKRGKNIYFVVNKIDTAAHEMHLAEFYRLGYEQIYAVSAMHGHGVYELLDDVVAGFPDREPKQELDGESVSIALVGRPNVGKSSIINAIIGQDRLITSAVPGTTRDTTDTLFKSRYGLVCFIDTAGMRRRKTITMHLEKLCVIMALKSIQRARVVALVLDATEPAADQDLKIGGMIHEAGRGCVILLNKWDLVRQDAKLRDEVMMHVRERFRFLDYAPVLPVSALRKTGLDEFLGKVFTVWDEANKRIDTAPLNKVLQETVQKHRPPTARGREVKFYYITQRSVFPPAFILFCNYPRSVDVTYKRYLISSFRSAFGFEGTPIRLMLRERK